MSMPLGDRAIGSTIRLRVSGTWRNAVVINHGAPNAQYQGADNVTFVVFEPILQNRQMHPSNVNDYQNSGMHAWLNNEFMNMLDADIRDVVPQIRIPFRPGSGTSQNVNGGANGLLTRAFLLSGAEVGVGRSAAQGSHTWLPQDEGALMAFFLNGDASSGAGLTARQRRIALNLAGSAQWWWLRSPVVLSSTNFAFVNAGGNASDSNASVSSSGVRPALPLPSSLSVSDTGEVVTIQPPTTPPSINVPATISAGTAFTISWGASTDPQSQAITYIVERSLNGGAFASLFTGMGLSTTDTVAAGTTTVAYRVRARNASGIESGNQTSDTRTVVNNDPPTIDGADGDLGLQTGPFVQNYTINDPNPGDVVTVTERLNGAIVRQFTPSLGAVQGFNVTADMFVRLAIGTHTMTVTAQDQIGASVTRTWTFSRTESQIDVTLANPLPASDMPARILVNVGRMIPAGAIFQVFACNNANDPTPTWEDVTSAVEGASIYAFTNTTAASAWGVNIRVFVDRNGATGPCHITSFGGNFDGGIGTSGSSFQFSADDLEVQ